MSTYYTLVLPRATPALTNEWNDLEGTTWTSQTRGHFTNRAAAHLWAHLNLIPNAPFTVVEIEAL
jgi:hypothetical protein